MTRQTATNPHDFRVALVEWLRHGTDTDLWGSSHPTQSPYCRLYTQRQWHDRGEPYGNSAVGGTIVTEGGPLFAAVNYGYPADGDSQLLEKFTHFLATHGYWFELGFHWSLHFYADDAGGRPESRTAQRLSDRDTAIRHLWVDCRAILDTLDPDLSIALQQSLCEIEAQFPHLTVDAD